MIFFYSCMFFCTAGRIPFAKAKVLCNVFTWRPTSPSLRHRTQYRHTQAVELILAHQQSLPFHLTLWLFPVVFGILSETILNCSFSVHLRLLQCSLWTSNLRAVWIYAELCFVFYDSSHGYHLYIFIVFAFIPMGLENVNLYFNLHEYILIKLG